MKLFCNLLLMFIGQSAAVIAPAAFIGYLAGASKCTAAEDLAGEAKTLDLHYAAELARLADWCRQKHLNEEAKQTLDAAGIDDPYTIRLPLLPRESGSLSPSQKDSGDRLEWKRCLTKLRQDHADALFDLSQKCAASHRPWLGYRLVLDALRADSDHEATRRVLGYVKYQNRWHTPYEVRMLQSGMARDEKFGWLEKSDASRYRRGERLFGTTWTDAATDAALHADIASGWDIETEHYRIRTNESIEAAVALGTKLESLNRAWREVFIGYYATPAELEAMLAGTPSGEPPAMRSAPRMEIVYFHNKQQYHKALGADVSMGLYVPENRTAYFYAGSEDSERTMYHEATHQLFQQSRRTVASPGKKANFWLVEGAALYMESFRREGDCHALGGLHDVRLEAARYHLRKHDFYVPFDKLARLGREDVQTSPDIAKLYSQMAAMTSFLMHYDGERYREALASCLRAVYDGNQDPELLARATGKSYAELDQQYLDYMQREAPRH